MGLGFITEKKGAIKKGWDREKYILSLDELPFYFQPHNIRTVQVKPSDPKSIVTGQELTIRSSGSSLYVLSGRQIIAECKEPPQSIIKGVDDLGGYAVGKVNRIKEISGFCDVEIYLESTVRENENQKSENKYQN